MKSLNYDWQKNIEDLPAKKISKNYQEIIKILEYRIKNNFYSKDIVTRKVAEKIISDLMHLPKK